MDPMNIVPLVLYLVAGLVYAVHFVGRSRPVGRAATTLLIVGALSHTFVIGMLTMQAGHVPFAGTTQTISTFVWLLALSYLYVEIATDEHAMGVFIVPLLVVLQTIPAFQPGAEARVSAVLESPWFGVHVSSLLFAYASFALAFVIGITYVLLFKEIKAKHLGFFYARLPSLQVLDTMNQRAIVFGWVFLTIGLAVGAIWTWQVRVHAPGDPRVQNMSLQDPKIFVALVCWAVYSFELFAARRIGWGGRRAAYLSALGFAIVLLNFVPISYFLTRSHDF
jgi:ABC-type transport system involved in cytochrome c biogenesis permease subunit